MPSYNTFSYLSGTGMGRQPDPMTREELRQHRNEILTVARGRGITAVRVFGSVARGEAHSGSDIDLIVEIEPGRSILEA